jgi:hypothetical protein
VEVEGPGRQRGEILVQAGSGCADRVRRSRPDAAPHRRNEQRLPAGDAGFVPAGEDVIIDGQPAPDLLGTRKSQLSGRELEDRPITEGD